VYLAPERLAFIFYQMPNTQHELLPLVVQENNVLVDAILLHRKLKVNTRFNDWIARKIEKYQFENGKDFYSNLSKTKGRPVTEYLLSIDMAKELAMLEENETGRQIRRYFIAKEKELRGISQLPKEAELFKGLKPKRINDREMYPYREMLARAGYTANANGNRRHRYWMHFIKEGNVLFVTKDFALHLYHQKKVMQNRAVMLNMQPVLPFNFAQPLKLKGGTHGSN
jgi:phage anti-repressor protein